MSQTIQILDDPFCEPDEVQKDKLRSWFVELSLGEEALDARLHSTTLKLPTNLRSLLPPKLTNVARLYEASQEARESTGTQCDTKLRLVATSHVTLETKREGISGPSSLSPALYEGPAYVLGMERGNAPLQPCPPTRQVPKT